MKSRKRLGKTLEDISHLFLSPGGTGGPSDIKHSPETVSESPGREGARIWMVISQAREILSAFFPGNLGVELARLGQRVLAIETTPLPSLDEIFGTDPLQPSLNQLLDRSDKQLVIEGPAGLNILSFRLSPGELQGFPTDEREILAEVLRKEEAAADLILIHADYSEDLSFMSVLKTSQGLILAACPGTNTPQEIYRILKRLFHVRPRLQVGIILYGGPGGEADSTWREKVDRGVTEFLGKRVQWLGSVPEDASIRKSLEAKIPLGLLEPESPAASALAEIAMKLQDSVKGAQDRSRPIPSFFNHLHQISNGLVNP